MQTDSSHSASVHVEVGSVVGLWRYPVKSMMGEELNVAEVTERGLVGDRQFAVVDASTGKIAGAKNPRKWGNFFDFRAGYVEPPKRGSQLPAVRLTLPDGTVVTSEQPDLAQILSKALGREVAFAGARGNGESSGAQAEEYWPDMDGLDHRDTVTEWELPAGTFFDLAVVHLLTTATIDRLRALYPEGRFEVRRFRPNIVVATGPDAQGFVENDWIGHAIAIGDEVRLRITGPLPALRDDHAATGRPTEGRRHPPYRSAAQTGECGGLCRSDRRRHDSARRSRHARLIGGKSQRSQRRRTWKRSQPRSTSDLAASTTLPPSSTISSIGSWLTTG
jgi:uncharacterized protein YcbX